jgi:hypothetical protein
VSIDPEDPARPTRLGQAGERPEGDGVVATEDERETTLVDRAGDESDPGPYPFDARTPIESGSDRHALIVERGTCRLYELFAASWNQGDPRAGSRHDL